MTGLSSTLTERYEVPSGGRAHGRIRVPSSKSVTHRFFNLALLAGAPLVIERPLLAEDTLLFLAALERAGFEVERGEDEVRLTPAGRSSGEVEIFCGNAGTMLRFLVASLTAIPGRWVLDGVPRLRERPVGPLVDALSGLGARIEYLGAEGFIPLRIEGGTLQGGTTSLQAGESSQYLSALLMAGLRAPGEVTVEVASLTSRPYVDVTLQAAVAFDGHIERVGPRVYRVRPSPIRAGRVRVEGDFSAACYPAAAAALTGGHVVLEGLSRESKQGDRGFMDLLAEMGAEISWKKDDLVVRGQELKAVRADLSGMPDQVPTLAALAPYATGETLIYNVGHLRIKESDRLEAMATELGKIGALVHEGRDSLRIPGIWSGEAEIPRDPVEIDPRGDHRIAMSLALAGLRRPGVAVTSPGVVSKSYPEFWRDLEILLSA
jgi:3-phosphoshikimate 1-carboxyvinyltransferase